MYLKRLWDTTEKKIVYAKGPTGHDCQVWTDKDGINLYIYDMAQWLEYTPTVSNDGKVYGPTWKAINGDDVVGYYETNEPTDLYSWESGDQASYVFKNYDGTVLQSGKVEEGETPEYTGDTPTKPTDTQYVYTFSGWNPTVGPIYKRTVYQAQFTSEPKLILLNKITSTSERSSDLFRDEREQPDYIGISTESDPETGDEMVMMDAHGAYAVNNASNAALIDFFTGGDEEYKSTMAGMVSTELLNVDGMIDATFMTLLQAAYDDPSNNTKWNAVYNYMYNDGEYRSLVTPQYTVTIQSNNTSYGTVDESSLTVLEGTALSSLSNVLTVGTTDVTATAETGYEFVSWTCSGSTIPATVTEDITIVANFQASTPTPTEGYRYVRWNITANSGASSGTQVSEFNLTDGTNAMARPAGTTVTCDKSTRLDGAAQNLIDGDTDTKFGSDTGTPYAITFDLGSGNAVDPTVYDHYNWYQANDAETETLRNPASWNVQFSEDGVYWETWSTVTGETIIDEDGALAGTWTLTAHTPILPGTYQQVQYIQNTGDEYISTGLGATYNSTEVEADFEVLTHTSNTETFIYAVREDGDGGFRAGPVDDNWTTTGGFTYDPSTYATNTRTVATGTSGITTSNYAYIFGQGEGASVTHYDTGTMKLYSLVIKENDVVVRNFVPCYIKATNEVGLYDTVTETFFGNTSGNGALVAGPDANS